MMNPNTLAAIKKDLASYLEMYNILCDYWCGENNTYAHIRAAAVLFQNAAFSGVECAGYDHNEAVNELYKIQNCLQVMLNQFGRQDYMLAMLVDELDMIITEHTMNEAEYQ